VYSARNSIAVLAIVGLLALPAVALATEGDLDPSFGTGGQVVTPVGGGGLGYAVKTDSQGRIVVAGWAGGYPNFDFGVARYLTDGSLDKTFNGTGVATKSIMTLDQAYGVAIDSQDRIVIAGTDGPDFALVRYTAQGALDNSFGTGGVVTTDMGNPATALAVALDSQGRIVLGGYAYNGSDDDFALARYTAGGALDPTFGTGGKVITPMGTSSNDQIDSLALDAQGRIVVSGYTSSGATNTGLALARYTDTGDLDSSFGTGGKVLPPLATEDDEGTSLAIDPQGRIVVGGHSGPFPSRDFAIWRFDANGNPDTSFNGGRAVTSIGVNTDTASAVAIDGQGRILEAGTTNNGTSDDFGVVRWTTLGALDHSFGSDGRMVSGFGPSSQDDANALTIDARQRIIVAGDTNAAGGGFAVARFIGDQVAPGVTITSGPAQNSRIRDRTPTFGFSVDDATASTGCSFDALAPTACSSPFTTIIPLADGTHTFTVASTDPAGNIGSARRTFRVDATAPRIRIIGQSKFRTHSKRIRVRFRLRTNERAKLRCKLDRRKARSCKARYRTPKMKPGKHRLTVTAKDLAGNTSHRAKKFRIVRRSP
jgi:uncharacterized delta-60 repeat protein